MSTAEPAQVESKPAAISPFGIGDELILPNNHEYEIEDIYQGANGGWYLKLEDDDIPNKMYRPLHRVKRHIYGGMWEYEPQGNE